MTQRIDGGNLHCHGPKRRHKAVVQLLVERHTEVDTEESLWAIGDDLEAIVRLSIELDQSTSIRSKDGTKIRHHGQQKGSKERTFGHIQSEINLKDGRKIAKLERENVDTKSKGKEG